MNLLVNQSNIGRYGLHSDASGPPESNQEKIFFEIENTGIGLDTTAVTKRQGLKELFEISWHQGTVALETELLDWVKQRVHRELSFLGGLF